MALLAAVPVVLSSRFAEASCELPSSADYIETYQVLSDRFAAEASTAANNSLRLGLGYLAEDKYDNAIEAFGRAIMLDETCAAAHLFWGWTLTVQGQFGCYELDGTEVCNRLGDGRMTDWTIGAVAKHYSAALSINPNLAVVHLFWARSLLAQSQDNPLLWPTTDPEPILAHLRTATDLDPTFNAPRAALVSTLWTYAVADAWTLQRYAKHVREGDETHDQDILIKGSRMLRYASEAESLLRSYINSGNDTAMMRSRLMEIVAAQGRFEEAERIQASIAADFPGSQYARSTSDPASRAARMEKLSLVLSRVRDLMSVSNGQDLDGRSPTAVPQ